MKLTIVALLMGIAFTSNAQNSSPDSIVQLSLDAYNNHDFELFMSYFHEDIEMFNLNECEPYTSGKEAVNALYKDYFEASPNLHSTIVNRMVFGNKVVDYEHITGARGDDAPFELIFMYEVAGDKIIRTTAIRK
ncbi:nuclear transport factor 2 family protein [Crocinitomicaceae bacterium]|nr:nuclear transport factor 2 family protein [Crocinitomicaceae bacterium]